MRSQSLVAVTLALALSLPASAGEVKSPLDASIMGSFVVVVAPLVLSFIGGGALSEAVSSERMERNKRWEVTDVRPQGGKTALVLRSGDKDMKIDMAVATAAARAQHLQVRDQLDIEPIGQTGYTVKKGQTTIGVLARPDNGMVHSTPRP
ncbi:hypothetical protein ACHAC9_23450 [Massilia sp. CMS3.1]|uniref:hypothetical protein n=1 Tax=Massilia sp. CMS3.1 TaxID=3373083 RepID=UPI003EE7E429